MTEEIYLHFVRSGHKIPLDAGITIAGRKAKTCDIILSDYLPAGKTSDISREHFKLKYEDESLVIIDLASTNGTEVDRVRLSPGIAKTLRHGSKIRLAKDNKFIIEIIVSNDPEMTTVKQKYPPGVYFDVTSCQFFIDSKAIPDFTLTELEQYLLKYLYEHIGEACSYDDLAYGVWMGGDVQNNAIAQTIGKLRKKLNRLSSGAGKRYIETLYRQGYRLKKP
jgi:pSer/pThr/pTyr-binding forkhead associated (FHA) protein